MYIENVTLKSVPADSLVLPVEEGTILTKNGTIPADLSQAYGIVPQKITNIPPTKKIYLAVAGTIDLKLNNVSFTEEEMQALGKDFNFVPGDEGGGNPNRVETITGTMADPWGDFDHQELFDALSNNNASCRLVADLTVLGMTDLEPLLYANEYETSPNAYSSGATIGNAEQYSCYQAIWGYINGDLTYFSGVFSGVYQDLSVYASSIPTTLTIIWHPLPDQS